MIVSMMDILHDMSQLANRLAFLVVLAVARELW